VNLKSTFLVALLLAACSLEHEVSRVTIPNTGLTVVVVEDEKSLYRYRIYGSGKTSSEGRIFGERSGRARDASLPTPVVSRAGDIASVIWPGTSLQIQIDVPRGVAVNDSNQAR
jgi:hypothetical protein